MRECTMIVHRKGWTCFVDVAPNNENWVGSVCRDSG